MRSVGERPSAARIIRSFAGGGCVVYSFDDDDDDDDDADVEEEVADEEVSSISSMDVPSDLAMCPRMI